MDRRPARRCHGGAGPDGQRPLDQLRDVGVTMDDITTIEELRTIYREPRGGPIDKEHSSITDHDRSFIAHSPIVMIGSSDAEGRCDVSPKGGPPGFVTV